MYTETYRKPIATIHQVIMILRQPMSITDAISDDIISRFI